MASLASVLALYAVVSAFMLWRHAATGFSAVAGVMLLFTFLLLLVLPLMLVSLLMLASLQ
jgi:hypothetical protein